MLKFIRKCLVFSKKEIQTSPVGMSFPRKWQSVVIIHEIPYLHCVSYGMNRLFKPVQIFSIIRDAYKSYPECPVLHCIFIRDDSFIGNTFTPNGNVYSKCCRHPVCIPIIKYLNNIIGYKIQICSWQKPQPKA